MEKEYNVTEKDLLKLNPLIADLRHEIGNPLNVLKGHIEMREDFGEGELKNVSEDQMEELEQFVEDTEYVSSYLDLMGTLPDEDIQDMQEYAEKKDLPEKMFRQVRKIASVTRDVYNYQTRLLEGSNGDQIEFSELLDPLESCAEDMDNVGTDFDYSGLEGSHAGVDSGMKLVFWTLGKNWEEHAYREVEDLELGFELDEMDDHYRVDVWDNGPGLFDEYPGDDRKSAEMRYRRADQLFRFEDKGGHGLGMAGNISEVYDSEIFYNEEIVEDEGFGVTVKLPKS